MTNRERSLASWTATGAKSQLWLPVLLTVQDVQVAMSFRQTVSSTWQPATTDHGPR
jgi:hypothetical protein